MNPDLTFNEDMIESINYTLHSIGPNCFIPIEEFPRRVDVEKLVANLVRTAIYEEAYPKNSLPLKLFLVFQSEKPDVSLLRELLPEINTIKIFDDVWELLQILSMESEKFFLIFCSTNRLKIAPHMNIASRSHYRKFLQDSHQSKWEADISKYIHHCEENLKKLHEPLLQNYNFVLQDVKSRFFTTDFSFKQNRFASRMLKNISSNQQKKDNRSEGSELPVGVGYFLFHSNPQTRNSPDPFLVSTRLQLEEKASIKPDFVIPIAHQIKKYSKQNNNQHLNLWIESPIIEFNILFFHALKSELEKESIFESINTNIDQVSTGWHPQLVLANAIHSKKDNQSICILLIYGEREADLFFLR